MEKTVITLKDGKVTTLFTERDFQELVDKYMGYDAMRYVREMIDKVGEAEGLMDENAELRSELFDLDEKLRRYEKEDK